MSEATNRLAAIASPAEAVAWSKLIDTAGDLAVNLAVAVVILAVTFWLAGWANRVVRAAFDAASRTSPCRPSPAPWPATWSWWWVLSPCSNS